MLLSCMHTPCSNSSFSSSQRQQIPTLQELALEKSKHYLLTKMDDEHYAEKVNKIFLHRDMLKGDGFVKFINNYTNINGEVIPFPTSEKSVQRKKSSIFLHQVILNNNPQAMNCLLQNGLSPHLNDNNNPAKNSHWNSPGRTYCCSLLTFAALCNADKIVRLLIDNGAHVNTNVNCVSAREELNNNSHQYYIHCDLPILHAASKLKYSPKIIEILIGAGAHVNSKNKQGQTPLDTTNYIEIKSILRNAGAKHFYEIPDNPSFFLMQWV